MKILTFIMALYGLKTYSITSGFPDYNNNYEQVLKIRILKDNARCTATIIDDQLIMLAAHCLEYSYKSKKLQVLINDQFKYDITNISIPDKSFWIKSKKFNRYKQYYLALKNQRKKQKLKTKLDKMNETLINLDLCLLKTKQVITHQLKRSTLHFKNVKNLTPVVAIGYGGLKDNIPQYRNEFLSNNNNQLELYSKGKFDFITVSGDSGGPLLLLKNKKQIGVLRGGVSHQYYNTSHYVSLKNHKKFICDKLSLEKKKVNCQD